MDPDLKTASKIFIFLLFTFIIFSHWIGEADNSSIDTTISIVEQGTFSIDEYHNNTRDKSYFDGHYYSDKAPLISFMAVPSYLLVDAIYPENYRPDFYLESFRRSFSDKLNLARFLAIITVTGVFGGLLGAIIYLILREMNTEKKISLVLALVGSLGTLIFPYSTTFHPTIVGTTFSSPYIDVNGFSRVRIATNCSGSCNRLNISHLDVRKLSEQPDTLLYSFGENWYQKSDKEDYRWSHGNNSIFVYSYKNRKVNKILWLEGKSFAKKEKHNL